MKKNTYIIAILFFLMILTLSSCTAQKKIVNRKVEHSQYGTMLLGLQTINQFEDQPFSEWYLREKTEYSLDKKSMEKLKKQKIHNFKIIAFVGTWCDDSHREFPRFMKILEELKYPMDKLEIIAVNKKRESPNGEEVIHNIQRVPTFILLKHNKEIGRIVEFPKSGYLEKDLIEISEKYYESTKNPFN